MERKNSAGFVSASVVLSILFGLLFVGASGFGVWAFMNYQDQKDNVDAKIASAVKVAKDEQSKEDETVFAEKEKQPTRQLIGPVDLGALSLDYPKTWSVYLENNGSGSQFSAILHPGAVTSTQQRAPYALRVNVVNSTYENMVATYQSQVNGGSLKALPIKLNDTDGLRIDGKFSDTITGSMVLFKIRDKTLTLLTESPTFVPDFDKIILPSLKFNK